MQSRNHTLTKEQHMMHFFDMLLHPVVHASNHDLIALALVALIAAIRS